MGFKLNTHESDYSMKQFPHYSLPKVVGYIGLENLMYARYLENREDVNYDLNLHMDKVIRKNPTLDGKLTELLHFLLENECRLKLPLVTDIQESKIICFRGLMTCVALTPYEYNERWKIVAILHKGDIYLCARDTEEKKYSKEHMTDTDKKFTSWGFKFEQYMLSDSPDSDPNPDVPVDETKEFSLVFSTRLNLNRIVFCAEMDGIRCDKETISAPSGSIEKVVQYFHKKEFIELKTSRHVETMRQENNFWKFKAKKWWCQSFFTGVNNIMCGYRNDEGIVKELKMFSLQEIPGMSKRHWRPNVCINFLDSFFNYVKKCLEKEVSHKYGRKALKEIHAVPTTCLLFEWRPGMPVMYENYSHEEDPILPKDFIENYGKYRDKVQV